MIDSPPSLDISIDLALYSSDYYLIVMDGYKLSLNGLENIFTEIDKIKIVKISEFKKINEVFVSKLDNLVKRFPEKIEKIEQAKKDISKILKSLEK